MNNAQSPTESKFHKIVISNADNREVQVTAWNSFIPIIHSIQLGNVSLFKIFFFIMFNHVKEFFINFFLLRSRFFADCNHL